MSVLKDTTSRPARSPRRAARAKVDYTLNERHRAAVERLEALADEIVAALDKIGVYADFEPVLGAPELSPYRTSATFREGFDQTHWAGDDVDEREPDDDLEPCLGSIGSTGSANTSPQTYWGALGADCTDLEKDDGDNERSLGWAEGLDQSRLGSGTDEAEYDLGAANPQPWTDQTQWGERNEGCGGGDAEEQCEDEGHDSDSEPDHDAEGDAQAPCH